VLHFNDFSEKQQIALSWWRPESEWSKYDALICDGAVRSGKTLSMGLGFMLWSMTCFSGRRFGLCGKTISALRRNVIEELFDPLRRMGFKITERRSENRLTIRKGRRENDYYLFGGRDESSASLIQGATLAGVLLDEVALMPRSFVEQACARCSVTGSRLWFNCNPDYPDHWFHREWIEQAETRNALHLRFTMDDNPSLAPSVRARYERMYDGAFYRRYVLGEWVAAEGLVYDFFDPSSAPPVPNGPFAEWYISCDYGTVNPASFGLWGRMGEVWYRVREFYFDSRRENRQMTDAEYAAALRELAGGREIRAVIVDPSAASFIETLRRDGWAVRRADNDVLTGIRRTADLLKSGKVVVCSACRDCLREFAQYRWDERSGHDAVRKEHDHAMDDLRYFCMAVPDRAEPFAVLSVRRG
jgi:PBSX family phage terminase large subunit